MARTTAASPPEKPDVADMASPFEYRLLAYGPEGFIACADDTDELAARCIEAGVNVWREPIAVYERSGMLTVSAGV